MLQVNYRRWAALAALAVMAGAVVSAAASQVSAPLQMVTVRSYRAASGTLIDAFCEVPFDLLEPLQQGPEGVAGYRVRVTVKDSTGLALTGSGWSQKVSG